MEKTKQGISLIMSGLTISWIILFLLPHYGESKYILEILEYKKLSATFYLEDGRLSEVHLIAPSFGFKTPIQKHQSVNTISYL